MPAHRKGDHGLPYIQLFVRGMSCLRFQTKSDPSDVIRVQSFRLYLSAFICEDPRPDRSWLFYLTRVNLCSSVVTGQESS
jgi:hypothetical protein